MIPTCAPTNSLIQRVAFYVTDLVFELPTGFLVQYLTTAKYSGLGGIDFRTFLELQLYRPFSVKLLVWGLMTTVNCTAKTFGGLMALRVLLGGLESTIAQCE